VPFTAESRLGDVLDSESGRAVALRYLPMIADMPFPIQSRHATIGQLVQLFHTVRGDQPLQEALFSALAAVPDSPPPPRPQPEPAAQPTKTYESDDVPRGSARLTAPTSAGRWSVFEIAMDGPSHGNPFTDVEVWSEFRQGERSLRVPGFYDGDGIYRIRFMPDNEGHWDFRTTSNARSLDGLSGAFECTPAALSDHGPVRVHNRFHFRHADGTRCIPLGTTAYAWTHQGKELEVQTLETLAGSGFTKLRMCVFPKHYRYNTNEPEHYPFPGSPDAGWDFTRFNPRFFHHLEGRIRDLGALGIEADLILFHAYDRWGFSDMGPAADDGYVRYVVARLAAFQNVWWALANEYDLLWSKTAQDWERLGQLVTTHDPYEHLLSNHNCGPFFDNSRPWVTHASMQRVDRYRTAENVDEWRRRWGKPVVVDECAYEGDLDAGWGNITGEELVRRFWEGAVRGGYVGHGETYFSPDDVIFWAKGGVFKGTSPTRIAFLREILADGPEDGLEPLPSDWDLPCAGIPNRYYLAYFGLSQPRFRTFAMPPGIKYSVDVIDTWNMTVYALPGTYEGTFQVELPGRLYIAVRLRAG
jgi:hypothetical protein